MTTGFERPGPAVAQSLRRRALDAARRLLESGGEEALHLRAIAAEIGCGAASLYHHFTGKDALLGALAVEGFQELSAAMARVVSAGEFVREIDGASAGYLRFMTANLQLYALMYSERILAGNEAVREAEEQILHRLQEALRHDVRVPGDRTEEAALAYSAFGRGIASMLLSQGGADTEAMRALGQRIVAGFAVLLSTEFMLAGQAQTQALPLRGDPPQDDPERR